MEQSFPQVKDHFFKTKDFQDLKIKLTYKGWEYHGNVDEPKRRLTWRDKLDYQLSYSYPEFAFNPKTGEKILDDDGKQIKNKNYKPEYTQGYAIRYFFEEGELTSGSYPLFRGFCQLQPKPKEVILIGKTGKGMDTIWSVTYEPEKTGYDKASDTIADDPSKNDLQDYPPENQEPGDDDLSSVPF